MTRAQDDCNVLHLACLIEDREDAEQKAMLAVAARLDREFNKQTVTNKRVGPASRLYRCVIETRHPDLRLDGLTKAQAATLAKLEAHADEWDALGGRSPYNPGR